MATPGLGLLLAFGLPMLPSGWSLRASDSFTNSTTQPPGDRCNGGLFSEAIVAITVVFSILGVLLIAVGIFLLMRKLREKRETEGTYGPAVRSRWVPVLHQPPTSSYPRRSGSSGHRGVGHRPSSPSTPRTALAHPDTQQPPWRHASL